MMANEFRTLKGSCAALVPQGPGYENVTLANQACTTVGSVPGQEIVSGVRYIALSFGYTYSHLWRVSNSRFIAGICVSEVTSVELRYHHWVCRVLHWNPAYSVGVQHCGCWAVERASVQAWIEDQCHQGYCGSQG